MVTVPINYYAVIVAAIVNMVVGYLWYGPLFGKPWAAMMGWTKESMDAKMKQGGMWMSYLWMFIGSLVMAYVLQHSLVFASSYLEMTGITAGLMVGFASWIGFIAPVMLGTVLWEGKSWKLYFLNVAYYLIGLLIMGVILAMWM